MKNVLRLFAVVAVSLGLAACVVTIPNPFGGPVLTLTGNYENDLPSIQAYVASLKAGAKADAATARGWLLELCPLIPQAEAQLNDPQTMTYIVAGAKLANMTDSALQKQLANVNAGLNVADKACATGTAPNWGTALIAAVDAVTTIRTLIKAGGG